MSVRIESNLANIVQEQTTTLPAHIRDAIDRLSQPFSNEQKAEQALETIATLLKNLQERHIAKSKPTSHIAGLIRLIEDAKPDEIIQKVDRAAAPVLHPLQRTRLLQEMNRRLQAKAQTFVARPKQGKEEGEAKDAQAAKIVRSSSEIACEGDTVTMRATKTNAKGSTFTLVGRAKIKGTQAKVKLTQTSPTKPDRNTSENIGIPALARRLFAPHHHPAMRPCPRPQRVPHPCQRLHHPRQGRGPLAQFLGQLFHHHHHTPHNNFCARARHYR